MRSSAWPSTASGSRWTRRPRSRRRSPSPSGSRCGGRGTDDPHQPSRGRTRAAEARPRRGHRRRRRDLRRPARHDRRGFDPAGHRARDRLVVLVAAHGVVAPLRGHRERRTRSAEASGQTAPVHVLDEISKSLPDRLWLVTLTQHGDEFTIDGRATSLSSLTDFVANLESTNWFKRPVEILDSAVEPNPQTTELVRFTIRAWYNNPDVAPVGPAGRGGRGAVPPAAH
ncbi:MAG: hypothetical protein DMF85_10520 [Acidobacteria bacterium]|nr:MAG: hypothetical protein DMF85_10520 [Acidobacteriota bacterium]